MSNIHANDGQNVEAEMVGDKLAEPHPQSSAALNHDSHEIAVTFSVRSILIWTTILAILLAGNIHWHLTSFGVLAVAMPVSAVGVTLIGLGILLADRRNPIRATLGDLMTLLGAMIMMLSATIISIGLVVFVAELSYWFMH